MEKHSVCERDLQALVQLVPKLLSDALYFFQKAGHPDWKGRLGGFFCYADGETGLPRLVMAVGEMPVLKAGKYLDFCQEKARRLAANPSHSSSWESREPGADQYGGAVRIRNRTFSFSGLPEKGDEALMLAVAGAFTAREARDPDEEFSQLVLQEQLNDIAAANGNEHWPPFRDFLAGHG